MAPSTSMVRMELIKRVEDADFSQRLRGYDMDEVDQFLESLAQDIGRLERELALARQELESPRPEPAAGEAPPEVAPPVEAPAAVTVRDGASASLHDPDGAVQRMLAIAQRTADEAIRESKIEANRVVAEAELRANTTVATAEEQRDAILAEAANEARRVAEATRRPLVEEIAKLEGSRDSLERDVSLLERHLAQQRSQLSASVKRLQQLLEDPDSFKIDKAPETSGATLPDHFRAAPGSPSAEPADHAPEPVAAEPDLDRLGAGLDSEPRPEPDAVRGISSPRPEPEPTLAPEEPTVADVTDLAEARREVVVEAAAPLPTPEPLPEEPAPPGLSAVQPVNERSPLDGLTPPPDTGPSSPIVGLPPADRAYGDDPGAPTEAVPLIDELLGEAGSEGDQFLDQLRQAADEPELGPSDVDADRAMAAFFDQDEEEGRRPRFGRRN